MNWARIGLALAMPLLLTSCLLTPGKFDAAMDVRKDGSFTYRYNGEIVLATAHAVMDAAAKADEDFDPAEQSCLDEDAENLETRDCTPAEIEEKKEAWEAGRAEREEENKRNAAMMKAMLGGIDPTDPKTMEEFARRLQGFEGWKRVTHKGGGVFDIQYEAKGRLTHDFIYPVFPDVDYIIPFVHVTRRTDGRVRIIAPAFVEAKEGNFGGAAMAGAMSGALAQKGGLGSSPWLKKPEGTFTLTTDAEILTNNTNDGPASSGSSKVLKWIVGPLDNKKPEALLKLLPGSTS